MTLAVESAPPAVGVLPPWKPWMHSRRDSHIQTPPLGCHPLLRLAVVVEAGVAFTATPCHYSWGTPRAGLLIQRNGYISVLVPAGLRRVNEVSVNVVQKSYKGRLVGVNWQAVRLRRLSQLIRQKKHPNLYHIHCGISFLYVLLCRFAVLNCPRNPPECSVHLCKAATGD